MKDGAHYILVLLANIHQSTYMGRWCLLVCKIPGVPWGSFSQKAPAVQSLMRIFMSLVSKGTPGAARGEGNAETVRGRGCGVRLLSLSSGPQSEEITVISASGK